MQISSLLTLIILIFGFSKTFSYKIPDIDLEILKTGGFRISIPDENGVVYVAYNINRNRPFRHFEEGEFSTRVTHPENNRWTAQFNNHIDKNDVLYIWINVQHDDLVYTKVIGQFSVENSKNPTIDEPSIQSTTNSNNVDNNAIGNSDDKSGDSSKKCEPSITVLYLSSLQGNTPCKGQLIFEEDFNESLNPSKWTQEIRLPVNDNDAEFVLYEENAKVENSLLNILPKPWNDDKPGTNIRTGMLNLGARCTGQTHRVVECERHIDKLYNVMPAVVTARINSKNSFRFKYGRIDIRAMLPQGDWLIPLLMLEPVQSDSGYDTIRIAFARGNQNLVTTDGTDIGGNRLYGGVILNSNDTLRESLAVKTSQNEHFGKSFHVYSLVWNVNKLLFSVDGIEYGQIDNNFVRGQSNEILSSIIDQQFYITLGLAVGGHADFPDSSISSNYKKPWNNTSPKAEKLFWEGRTKWKPTWIQPELKVDYVRVYAI